MRKVIDLCLDMPMGAEALTNMLGAMCLDPLYRGYKKTYGAGVAAQVGLTVEEIDAIYESEGRDGFLRIIREAAEKHAVKPAEFVRHLDEVGVESPATVITTTARRLRSYRPFPKNSRALFL